MSSGPQAAIDNEKYASWMTHSQVMEALYPSLRKAFIPTLVGRLRAGKIDSAGSECALMTPSGTFKSVLNAIVPNDYWQLMSASSETGWKTGDFKFSFGHKWQFKGAHVTAHFYGLRFEPGGVNELVPKTRPVPIVSQKVQAGDWISAKAALELLESEFQEIDAVDRLRVRLVSGSIVAHAREIYANGQLTRSDGVSVPDEIWKEIGEGVFGNPVWRMNDLTLTRGYVGSPRTKFTFGNVAFLKEDVETLLSNPPRQDQVEAARPEEASPNELDEESRKNPLSAELLADWAKLYLKAYPVNKRSEPLARRSVDGMFPDKSVTRDRLRAILSELGGGGVKGKKAADPAD